MRKHTQTLLLLALAAIITYLPTLRQPLLEDDYPLIAQAHTSGFGIVTDQNFGLRSTSLLVMDGVYRIFDLNPPAFYSIAILLHVLNTWLVYALGFWRPVGYATAAWAAFFFAVCEVHAEGIMWVSATNETLLFLFGVGSLLCFLRFVRGRIWTWYAASLVSFSLALLSKESAYIFFPLLVLALLFEQRPLRELAWLAPFAMLTACAITRILSTRHTSFRYNSMSFSLDAPFGLVWTLSFVRLFWFWGALALLAILLVRPPRSRTLLAIGMLWAGLSLVPYSFLTYLNHVPSRHTYLASAGIALIVGFALVALAGKWPRSAMAVVCGAILVVNVGYLWTKKRAQFLERAAPTEQLIALARSSSGPIYVKCFPRPPVVAESALELTTGRPKSDLIWNAEEARARHALATFCYSQK